eukprot:TRINITY_DN1397_c0_g1_i1.p1 TRINITY_DN1397_c0_g1~~TRINITY_DN1397_c0_g1_i1.p1  ORF type:complete len:132 (-),score=23.81 TRINITY_DN1397_c0_g1_i1:3-398(-)
MRGCSRFEIRKSCRISHSIPSLSSSTMPSLPPPSTESSFLSLSGPYKRSIMPQTLISSSLIASVSTPFASSATLSAHSLRSQRKQYNNHAPNFDFLLSDRFCLNSFRIVCHSISPLSEISKETVQQSCPKL